MQGRHHTGCMSDRVARRRAAASRVSSVGPNIAVTLTPSAAARCMAPESFVTSPRQCDRTPASVGRSVRPIRLRHRGRAARSALEHRVRRSRRPPRCRRSRTGTPSAASAIARARRTRPAASASRRRTRRPAPARRAAHCPSHPRSSAAAPRPRARRPERRRAARSDRSEIRARAPDAGRRRPGAARACGATARVSSAPRQLGAIAPALGDAGAPRRSARSETSSAAAARYRTAGRELGAERSPVGHVPIAAARAARCCRSRRAPARKSGAIAGRAATVIDAAGRRAADVGDRRQRHHGVAQPVRREDDQPIARPV